ncbi:hypothetical protein [Aeromonas bestiarum]|uniref:Phage protein n=1 Tax=Aeromonas bestiarum TaxID=105751 RepID=A0ABT7Q4L7_9GAMM|nr:hypothetical protein [Aeromonas bestiarum]MDM5073851.1 hypothetical protein [Aeromonas bestiarum]
MSKEPSAHELKQTWELPAHAKMLGWLLHDPYKDEFLVKYTSNSDMAGMWWGLSPETAKAFKTLKKATAVLESLDLAGRAVAAPAFDIGKQIIVLTDDIGVENPLRKVIRLMQEAERDDANN